MNDLNIFLWIFIGKEAVSCEDGSNRIFIRRYMGSDADTFCLVSEFKKVDRKLIGNFGVVHKKCFVRDAGIEPATSSVSRKRSTTKLIALCGRGRNRTYYFLVISETFCQ